MSRVGKSPIPVPKGAEVTITDIHEETLKRVSNQYGVKVVGLDEIYDVPMDIYAPCALGATVNDDTINRLKCSIIAGAANNQLANEKIHGQLVKDKGINELIQAFCRLPQEQHPVKLLLVGDYESDLDPLQPNTLAQITSNPNIISTGFQSDVRPYFCLSHALVFPTYREGFPNVVLQAGALDLPGIVTNINGCNEIVVPGKNGLIIPVKEENAIFDAMQFFIHHPQETSTMKKNAREMIETRYKQAVVWEAIRQEYQIMEQYV